MFGNQKLETSIEDIKKQLKSIATQQKKQDEQFLSVIETQKELSKEIKAIKTQKESLLDQAKQLVETLEQKNTTFDRVIRKLEQTQNAFEQKLSERASLVLTEELRKIQQVTGSFEAAKKEITAFSQDLSMLKKPVEEFRVLAKTIKDKDFELNSVVEKITQYERQKVQQEQQIEHLRSILAKMKQSRPPMRR